MTSAEPAPKPVSGEDRRQHLAFVQDVIARMSSASGVAKGWALTVATAAFGYAGTKESAPVALIGIFAVLLFATVDARYLREERKYRALFNGVRRGEVEAYEMNAARYCATHHPNDDDRPWSWGNTIGSWSIRDFYGLILLAGVAVLIWTLCRG